MNNQVFQTLKSEFIDYVAFCYSRNNQYEPEYLVNNFLFDNITALRDVPNPDEEQKEVFKEYDSKNAHAASFIRNSLDCFLSQFEKTRASELWEHSVIDNKVGCVETIFLGLQYTANNNADYTIRSSALALSIFNIR